MVLYFIKLKANLNLNTTRPSMGQTAKRSQAHPIQPVSFSYILKILDSQIEISINCDLAFIFSNHPKIFTCMFETIYLKLTFRVLWSSTSMPKNSEYRRKTAKISRRKSEYIGLIECEGVTSLAKILYFFSFIINCF